MDYIDVEVHNLYVMMKRNGMITDKRIDEDDE